MHVQFKSLRMHICHIKAYNNFNVFYSHREIQEYYKAIFEDTSSVVQAQVDCFGLCE